MAKRKAPVIPINAVRLTTPPVNRLGRPCDFDGDINIYGQVVWCVDGQWWGVTPP